MCIVSPCIVFLRCFFFFNDTATTELYTYGHTLSLHDALPISRSAALPPDSRPRVRYAAAAAEGTARQQGRAPVAGPCRGPPRHRPARANCCRDDALPESRRARPPDRRVRS